MSKIKKILSGDVLQKGIVFKNLPFLLYITFLLLLYVAYGYKVDNTVRLTASEDRKSELLYSELQSVLELFDKEALQSNVAKKTAEWGLYESIDPPTIIRTIENN